MYIYNYTYTDIFVKRSLFKKFENQDLDFLIQVFSLLRVFAFEVITN